jgi:hypothetical protein
MERTPAGQVLVYKKSGFGRPNGLDPLPSRAFWPVDAREIVGKEPNEYSFTPFPPDGTAPAPDTGKLPPSPHLGKVVEQPLNAVVAKAGVTVEEAKKEAELAPGVPLIVGGAGTPQPSTLKPAK